VTIACALCVGSARELYLSATLESIAGAVDLLVVNDNSGLAHSENIAALEASAFAERGALEIGRSAFVDFADMRNRAFAPLLERAEAPDWMLWLDADEVHGPEVRYLAREVLPRLDASTAQLDGYTYNFFGTFDWISDVARRMLFYRFSRELRWVNPVHEKLTGLRGREVVVPYVYHHYGNVVPPRMLAEKHLRYFALGNPVPRPPDADAADLDVYLAKANAVRPYRGTHPQPARPIVAELERRYAPDFAALDAGFRSRRSALARLAGALRGLNEDARVGLRRLERPGLYAPSRSTST